jgi:2,3-bisphosphoglycerate-independent phosphoglycerate mutase
MKPVLLAILDGFGIREESHGNAILQAKIPTFRKLWKTYPHGQLIASGEDVGLPKDQMGNSEVGHLNIGAGRIVYQPLQIITKSIKDKSFFENEALLEVINHVKDNNSKLHIMGLISDGGVHSHIDHVLALMDLAKENNIDKLYIHVFTDGRDTLPTVCKNYIEILENKIKEINLGVIATISGRYYAMDRDKKWERSIKAYDVIVNSEGPFNENIYEVIENNYANGKMDEFIEPTVINKNGNIENNDGLLFANFRTDRATQILAPITNPYFKDFDHKELSNVKLTSLMPCSSLVIGNHAFNLEELNNTLGIYLSNLSFTQLRIAETEKYAHVTYFFDGGKDTILEGCDRALIPSPKVDTYDLKPEMSAYEVTQDLLKAIEGERYDFILLNFANPDMVGHTGNIKATIKALETIDTLLNKIYNKVKEKEGILLVTADHGNAEFMLDENNNMVTAHTTNKVPFIVCNDSYKVNDGILADIAPTILELLNAPIPKEMTGKPLIQKKDL